MHAEDGGEERELQCNFLREATGGRRGGAACQVFCPGWRRRKYAILLIYGPFLYLSPFRDLSSSYFFEAGILEWRPGIDPQCERVLKVTGRG